MPRLPPKPSTIREVKFDAGAVLNQGAVSCPGRVAALGFLRLDRRSHQTPSESNEHEEGDRGEKIDARSIVIFIPFGSCFWISALPGGIGAPTSPIGSTLLRKCCDG